MSTIPLLVRGERIRALVVGGGEVATRKVLALLDGGSSVRVVATAIAVPLRELAVARGDALRLDERPYAATDIGDANLVVAATSSRETNAAVANDADRAGRLASVADAPDEGAWTAMATHRAGDLVVAVSAAGVPGAARRVRDALASRFDSRYADGLARLATLRRETIARRGRAAWRRAADDLTGAAFCDDVESGAFAERLTRWEREDAWR